MKLNYTKKIFIISAAVLVGIIILVLVFTNLLLGKIYSINDKVKQMTISSIERERNISLKESIHVSESDRGELAKYFMGSTDADTADFIGQLENLGKQLGLTVNVKSVEYEKNPNFDSSNYLSLVRVKVGFVGKWSGVFDFLQKIERLSKTTLIHGVSLDNSSKIWSGDIDFSVFKLKN